MSSLIGAPGERLPLPKVIDALATAARQAGRPGLIWLTGLLYPGITFTFVTVGLCLLVLQRATDARILRDVELTFPLLTPLGLSGNPAELLLLGIVLSPLLLIYFRFNTGLAWVSAPDTWNRCRGERATPRFRETWRGGKGITRAGFGMWLTMMALNLGALVLLLGPLLTLASLFSLQSAPPLLALFLAPVILVLVAYALVLEVLMQLGLHSLARNRRGVGSALMHAWRLVRAEPWAAFRCAAVDLGLQLAAGLLWQVSWLVLCCTAAMSIPLGLALLAFTGVMRAAFWAQVYRQIGGLGPADGVPGLVAESSA